LNDGSAEQYTAYCRWLSGQIDGIGSRPRLRANGVNGDPLADRAYPIEAVSDIPAAMVAPWRRLKSTAVLRGASVIRKRSSGYRS
jgi:hypothetical protein